MSERRTVLGLRRAREFESFVAGTAARLLHVATLLTAETPERNPYARELLTRALARVYAQWDRDRRRGEDPYDRTRQELVALALRRPRRRGRRCGGVLERLPPQQRTVLVLRLYESLPEEQVAAPAGLSAERVRTLCRRAVTAMCAAPPRAARKTSAGTGAPMAGPGPGPGPLRREEAVLRMMTARLAPPPAGLAAHAARRGARLRRRRRAVRGAGWALLLAVAAAFALWAASAQPWTARPMETTPLQEGW